MSKTILLLFLVLLTNYSWSQVSTNSSSILPKGNSNQIAPAVPGDGDPIEIPIADRVRFLYDESGNQRERQICINCIANKPSGQVDDIANKNILTQRYYIHNFC